MIPDGEGCEMPIPRTACRVPRCDRPACVSVWAIVTPNSTADGAEGFDGESGSPCQPLSRWPHRVSPGDAIPRTRYSTAGLLYTEGPAPDYLQKACDRSSQAIAQQREERLAQRGVKRAARRVGKRRRVAHAQKVQNCRRQFLRFDSAVARICAVLVARSIDAGPADPRPRQRETEHVPPVVAASLRIDLGVRPNSPIATTSVSDKRPRCSRSSMSVVNVTSNCGQSTSCNRSAFWACVSHSGLPTASSPPRAAN